MIELLEGKLFKTFITVIEEKNFSRAAEKLGYVQSTVTTHIKSLEEICNKKLFYRLSHGVIPTKEGEKLIEFAYRFINLGEAVENAIQKSDGASGSIRIKMIESFFLFRLESIIGQFIEHNSNINLKIYTGFQNDIVESVLQFSVDVGIVPQDPKKEDILFYPIVEEELVFIGNNNMNDEVLKNDISILKDKTLISYGPTCLYHVKAMDVLYNHNIYPKDIIELPSIEMIKKSVICKLGYGLVPKSAILDEINNKSLNILPIKISEFLMHGFIVNKNRDLRSLDKKFISTVTSSIDKSY